MSYIQDMKIYYSWGNGGGHSMGGALDKLWISKDDHFPKEN